MKRGFTLIELLIVVAIIAILAAIAVPNFIEAQIRSKVARVNADMRAIATALEAYCVDTNGYPMMIRMNSPTGWPYESRYRSFCHYLWAKNSHSAMWLTTPVAYMTSIPGPDPFRPIGADPRYYGQTVTHAYMFINVLSAYKDKQRHGTTPPGQSDIPWHPDLVAPAPVKMIASNAPARATNWAMMSVGPDRTHGPSWPLGSLNANIGEFGSLEGLTLHYGTWINGQCIPYDPSNGSASSGDIWRMSD